jgi:hypothetical protein
MEFWKWLATILTAIITYLLTRMSKKHRLELKNLALEAEKKRLEILKLKHELTEKGASLPSRKERLPPK